MTTEAATPAPGSAPALTREGFEALAKSKYAYHTLPSGERIIFSTIRRSVRYALDEQFFDEKGNQIESKLPERPARLMAIAICDAKGKRLFTDDEWETIDALPPSIFDVLWADVKKHIGIESAADDASESADSPNG